MNYYNPYGNFCMEYSDETCEVLGVIVVDAKEVIWRMRVPKSVARNITADSLSEHYLEAKYSEAVPG